MVRPCWIDQVLGVAVCSFAGAACTLINPTGEVVRLPAGEGGGPPSLQCSWTLSNDRLVKSLKDEPVGERAWDPLPLLVVAAHTDFRILVDRKGAGWLDVYTLDDAVVAEARYTGHHELHDVWPIGGSRIGALYDEITATSQVRLMLLLLDNLDFAGGDGVVWPLTKDNAFMAATDDDLVVTFTPVGDGGAEGNHVAFAARYQAPAGIRLVFGRSEGQPVDVVQVNADDASLNTQDTEPRSVVRDDAGINYIFVGLPGSTKGPRMYMFDDGSTFPVEPHQLGTTQHLLVDVSHVIDGALHVGMGDLSAGPKFFTGRVPLADVPAFDVSHLQLAVSYESLGSLPVALNPRWLGDVLPLVGQRFDSPEQLAILIADAYGQLRTHQDLPLSAPIDPGVSRTIVSAAAAPRLVLGTQGGELNVVWIEKHEPPGDPAGSYHVMYTNRLSCMLATP